MARARVVDQSGNRRIPTDPNATANFVVDTATPAVADHQPGEQQRLHRRSRPQTFTVQASENLDLTHFTAAQIQLHQVGLHRQLHRHRGDEHRHQPDHHGGLPGRRGDAAGTGREQITFTSQSALANGLYQLTLVGTGTNAIRDIAGNLPTGGDVVITFAVFDQSNIHGVFVGAGFTTDPTQPAGRPGQPVPDDHRRPQGGLGGRPAGDPARRLHRERHPPAVRQPGLGRHRRAPNTNFVPGNALDTIIRAPAVAADTGNITITATNLQSPSSIRPTTRSSSPRSAA